jgi:hypothetical protein
VPEATDTATAARDAVWRLGAQLSRPALQAGRDELFDPLFWSEMAQVALAAAASYAETRARRARRARRRRALLGVTALTLAGAAGYAVRRR